jgi:hypothetical protein
MPRLILLALLVSFALAPLHAAEPANPVAGIELGDLGNRSLREMGFVDVTAAPFSADPTGKVDSTAALRRAILFAREQQMAAYFPTGVYLVSDTIECLHGRWDPLIGEMRGGRDHACILIGDRSSAKRPTIRLAPNSPGYGDAAQPKYVLRFWARGTGKEAPPTEPQPNINMNQMLIGIDLEIGEGNPGAVAVRHRAAQGSSVQDCFIDARHGLTGLEGGAGSGGSHFNVTVLGGRIGVDFRQTQPAPTIVGFHLIDQTERAILSASRQTLVAVGCRIETKTRGPVIETAQTAPHHGQLSLVDCQIEFDRPGDNTAIAAGAAVTMHDVYVRGAATIVRQKDAASLSAKGEGWQHVREFALGVAPPPNGVRSPMPGLQYAAPIYIDGRRLEDHRLADVIAGAPPDDLVKRHQWSVDFPSWQSSGAVNVKESPYLARGDGVADDTAALQRAVDEHAIVFLPKGTYAVSRPIALRPATQLLGAGRCFSWIVPRGDAFDDAGQPQPLVRTADDASAPTTMAFLGLRVTADHPGAYCLNWRCGRSSVFRDVNIELRHWPTIKGRPQPMFDHPLVLVSGHGGGKWYNFHQESWHLQGPNYRHLLIDGTRAPLHFYQCNPEHARSEANMEIRNAKHVSLYGVKGEYAQPIVAVRHCDHVRIFGYGGNASAPPHRALFVVEDTPNFLATNLVDSPRFPRSGSPEQFAGEGVDPRQWHMLIEKAPASAEVRTAPLDRPVLYRRGAPQANEAASSPSQP